MNNRFQGDIKVQITANGARMKFIDGEPVRDRGIENAICISLFTKPNWWGNTVIRDTNKKIGSNFERQRVINTDTPNDVTNDANNALKSLIDSKLLSEIEVQVTNPNLNHINTYIKVYPPGKDIQELLFYNNGINWVEQAINPAYEKMEDVE